jgi:phosphatidate cytidylyltransferase
MTTKLVRYGIGSVLVLLIVAIFELRESCPLLGPCVALALGVLAAAEYLKLVASTLPRALVRVSVLFVAAVVGLCGWCAWRADLAAADLFLALILPAALFVASLALIAARREKAVAAGDLAAVLHVGGMAAFTLLPLAALACLMADGATGMAMATLVVLGSKGNDIGGYVGGTLLGRHKLCSGVSPNKTVEGAICGAALGIGVTVLLARNLDVLAPVLAGSRAWALGLALALSTQTGDLIESALKRSVAAKDSGQVLPAFGGVLDLVDSLIFSAPLGYTLARAWLN